MTEPQNKLVPRTLVPFVLVLGLLLPVAACGNKDSSSGADKSVMSTEDTAATKAAPVESPKDAPKIAMGEMTMGPADAPITMIEYASLTCHHCADFYNGTFVRLKPAYIDTGKIHFIMRDFPLDRLAYEAAVLAHCAGEDKYFAVVDKLFSTQHDWLPHSNAASEIANVRDTFVKIGEEFGVSKQAYDACLANKTLESRLLARIQEARDRYGVDATPTIIINGKEYDQSRAFTVMSDYFNKLLAKQ